MLTFTVALIQALSAVNTIGTVKRKEKIGTSSDSTGTYAMPVMRVLNARRCTSAMTVGTSFRPPRCAAALLLPAGFRRSPASSVPPDVGKCRSSARQTGHRCPRTILPQTCALATPAPTRTAAPHALSAIFRVIVVVVVVRACSPRRAPDSRQQQHHLRRPLAERALLPSRLATHTPVRYAPRLRRIPPSRRAAVLQVEYGHRLASC